jgi:hypothetical protein
MMPRQARAGIGRWLATLTAVAIAMALAAVGEAADDAAARVMADAVRAQGFACADPVSAERDPAESKPDAPVWILACRDARYRVRARGDVPAEVEPLK